ncbi:hypothetical protein MD484_g3319, partial [Candolleomyces efflorescens]
MLDFAAQLALDPSEPAHSLTLPQGVSEGTSINDEIRQGSDAWGAGESESLSVGLQEIDVSDPWRESVDPPASHEFNDHDTTAQDGRYAQDNEETEDWSSDETLYEAAEETSSHRDDETCQNPTEGAAEQPFHVVDYPIKTDDLDFGDPWFGHASQPGYMYHDEPSAPPAELGESKSPAASLDLQTSHQSTALASLLHAVALTLDKKDP